MTLKHISSFMDKPLLMRALLLQRMTAAVRRQLPEHLAERCQVSDFKKERVTITTTEQACADPLRFQQQTILKQLNEEFSKELRARFRKMQVHVLRFPVCRK